MSDASPLGVYGIEYVGCRVERDDAPQGDERTFVRKGLGQK
ncbi:hypothetical protein FACS1894208_05920 [Clostridia bacterium]|nr:hypothetical protein FACS1894208_05920 [Clostridia bacterium]